MNRNTGISLLRVCSMFMIVLCHYSNYIGLSWLAQFLNVGVFVFLLISGWLYSKKEIEKPAKWLLGRWIKLCIPILIWMCIIIAYGFAVEKDLPSFTDVLLFISNLQGVSWIIPFFPKLNSEGVLGGLGNLWFVTVIMICYLILIIVKRSENKINKNAYILNGVLIFVSFFILSFLQINLIYFICFLIGLVIGKKEEKSIIDLRNYIILTIGMIIAIILRLLAKHFLDDTFVYNIVVVGLSHTVIAIWIFLTIRLLDKRISWIHTIASSSAIRKIDSMSYYLYITHYYFLINRFGLKELSQSIIWQTVFFCILMFMSSLVLKWISEKIVINKIQVQLTK